MLDFLPVDPVSGCGQQKGHFLSLVYKLDHSGVACSKVEEDSNNPSSSFRGFEA